MKENFDRRDVSPEGKVLNETKDALDSLKKELSDAPRSPDIPAGNDDSNESNDSLARMQDFSDGIDALLMDDTSNKFQQAILNDVLDTMRIDDALKGKSLEDIFTNIMHAINTGSGKTQPSKRDAFIAQILRNKIASFNLNESFDTLSVKKKVQILSLYHSYVSKPPIISSGGVGERLQGLLSPAKQKTYESRYQFWMAHIVDNVNAKFKGMQKKGIEQYLQGIAAKNPELGLDHTAIDEYIQELQALKNHLESTKPQEGNAFGYIFALVIGIGIGMYGKHKYDEFMKPKIERGLPIGEITLMNPEVLSLITTAKQSFTVAGERTDKQFDSSQDTGLAKIAKDALNTFQSRTIRMNMQGSVEVTFNFQEYTMNFDGKRLQVIIQSPTYRVAESDTFIYGRNSEWIETNDLNQTEQELSKELKEKAIDKAIDSRNVEFMAKEQLSKLLYELYHVVDPKLEGVDVVIKGDPTRS